MKFINYLDDFINYLLKNNFNKSTVNTYYTGIKIFNLYLDNNNININNINDRSITTFLNLLKNKNSTKNVYRAGIIKYINFLNDYKNSNINFKSVDRFKREKAISKVISWIEINSTLDKLRATETQSSLRDLAILNLVIKTGIKISDLIKIKKDEFSLQYNSLIIKNHEIKIDNELSKILNELKQSTPDGCNLIRSYSKNNNNNNLTIRSVEIIIKKYFPCNNYNDLKMTYFINLLDILPEINIINTHKSDNSIKTIKEIITNT